MNSDRSIDKLLEVFGVPNLSNLGSDVIIKYFDDISVKEVMKLCRVNKQFNTVCQKESMWKRKVKNDYGVETKYGRTWKETAQFLFEYDMINLNQKWVNGKTYKELFDESLVSKNDDYFENLYYDYDLLPLIFPSYVKDIQTAKLAMLDSENSYINIYICNRLYDNILEDEGRLKKLIAGMTREFTVIAFASKEIKGEASNNSFGLSSVAEENAYFAEFSDKIPLMEISNKLKDKIKKLTRIVDPNLYIMTYSIMSLHNLFRLDVCREGPL